MTRDPNGADSGPERLAPWMHRHAQHPASDDPECRSELAVAISHLRREVEVECVRPSTDLPPRVRCFLRTTAISVVTGDRVRIERDPERPERGVITEVLPRTSLLTRHQPTGPRPICANLDRLLITIAPDPAPHVDLIDRYLVAAALDDLEADLVLNKCDQPARDSAEVNSLLELYRGLGIRVFETSASTGAGLPELAAALGDATAALVGQSGVGKSSLINILLPAAEAAVGALSAKRNRGHGRGRHTTSTARLYRLGEALIVDSPGIRELAPEIPSLDALTAGFPEIADHVDGCRFRNCRHDREPGCRVQAALIEGRIDPRRWRSYCGLKDTLPPR